MFFFIGQKCPITSLLQVSQNIFLDKSWTKVTVDKNYWYKGYSTECNIKTNFDRILNGYRPAGKWAVISQDGDILYSPIRPFPIYKWKDNITNIPLDGVIDTHYEIQTIEKNSNITLDEAANKISAILLENIQNFFTYNEVTNFNVLFSAGLDTLTVWALIDSLGYNYNLHIHTPKQQNVFGTKSEYSSDLLDICRKKFWGYRMTSCFNNLNWYLTGFYSERFQLREVSQGHAIANYRGVKLQDLPKKTDYLYYFLRRPQCKINKEPTLESEAELLAHCNKSVFYDHQMWHIDNNFHFSPFFDLRITKIVNNLSLDDLVKNALTGHIQKEIIKINKPEFLQILADYKNEGDVWKNYRKNFSNLKLGPHVQLYLT